jgi:hypothetical protein
MRGQYEDLPKFDQFPVIRFVKSMTSMEHATSLSRTLLFSAIQQTVLNDAVLMLEFAGTYGQSVVAVTYPHDGFC